MPCIVLGAVLGLALLLAIAVTIVLATPKARMAVLRRAVTEINKRTDLDVDLGGIYLSPFHQSPKLLYRAYKGKADLPLHIEIDSLYIGHRGHDTMLYVRSLRLRGNVEKPANGVAAGDFAARNIVVDQLRLRQATFHSDSLIASVGIDAIIRQLDVSSPRINIVKGRYPLHGLRLVDAYVGIGLRDTPSDTSDTTTTPMAFEVPDGELRNVRFVLNPEGLDLRVGTLSTSVLADVGGNRYDARRLNVGDFTLTLESLQLPFDTIHGSALVDLNTNLINSSGLHARSDSIGAQADLSAVMLNLETMLVDVAAQVDFRGSKASLKGFYDIDDEAYDMTVDIEQIDTRPFMGGEAHAELAGVIHAQGKGLDPASPAMKCKLAMHLTKAVYDQFDVSGMELGAELANKTVVGNMDLPVTISAEPGQRPLVSAKTRHQFRVSDFMTPKRMSVDYHTQMTNVVASMAGQDYDIGNLDIDFATNTATSLQLATQGLDAKVQSPMHLLQLVDDIQPLMKLVADTTFVTSVTSLRDLSMLDTLRQAIPGLRVEARLTRGSPVQTLIEQRGLDINEMSVTMKSDSLRSDIALDISTRDIDHSDDSAGLRLPAATASVRVSMTEGKTAATLSAGTSVTDGVMSVTGICADASMKLDLERNGRTLNGTGHLELDSLVYGETPLGNRTADIRIAPSELYENALRADVRLDDIPLKLLNSFLQIDDIDLRGLARAKGTADGLPAQIDLSAEVLPIDAGATYKPYNVTLNLEEKPIVMEHNKVRLDDMRIYSTDSSYLALNGGLDLGTMRLDVGLTADNFSPAKLEQGGPIPVYGDLATNIRGRATGPLDSIAIGADVTILPSTDITYPIDKKNLAQVKPHGTVNVRYNTADGGLNLDGKIHVDDGMIRYSPKLYPIMPFSVDSGSHIAFNGPLGETMVNVSASQQVKADVQSEGEETRRVIFNTGVRVNSTLDSMGLNAIGFFLEAPNDETITRELASMDDDTREGIAAVLLATGMYMGESNVAAQREGYALSSIVNSRINAAMANSKMGKLVDVDISSGQTIHASGKTNDMNIAISKTLFNDKLRVTLGSTISDNPEVNKANGLLSLISADYSLTKSGNVVLQIFSKRDYENILEGELNVSGIGVKATKEWKPAHGSQRTNSLTANADVAYRSNNSIGPNLTIAHSIGNLMGHGERFIVKGHGAYYWSLADRDQQSSVNTQRMSDTYKFGVDAALVFPYLHWAGDNNPEGDTRYQIGYKYENIAGGYGIHKFSGGFSYFIRPSRYVTHVLTPFSLSVVKVNVESDDLLTSAVDRVELLRVLAGDEFVPSVGYSVTYNDYRAKRTVNTMADFEIKESGNLLNAAYCLAGRGWDEQDKTIIGKMPFNQFVKVTAELCNRFNLTEKVCIATRLYAGANIPLGNSASPPLSEAFYTGGPNSLRASAPYAYGPGNFYSQKYNHSFFHGGDVKLEANFELRFPIVWKLFGAVFLDAGNVWNWHKTSTMLSSDDYATYLETMGLSGELEDGIIGNHDFAKQIALGTGAGLRLDIDGLVIRLDLGVGIHAPFQTYKYNKDGTPDYTRPITTYYNLPRLDGLRLNFSIGYPF